MSVLTSGNFIADLKIRIADGKCDAIFGHMQNILHSQCMFHSEDMGPSVGVTLGRNFVACSRKISSSHFIFLNWQPFAMRQLLNWETITETFENISSHVLNKYAWVFKTSATVETDRPLWWSSSVRQAKLPAAEQFCETREDTDVQQP